MTRCNRDPVLDRRTLLHWFAGSLSLAAWSGMLTGCAKDPVTGENTFVGMSEADEIRLDRSRSPYQFSSDYGQVQDAELNAYVNEVGLGMAHRSHRPKMPYSFRVVNAAYINAYAFPGGSIAATRGILLELENEAQLAALLGHEIGHVNARHAAEQAFKGTLASALLAGLSLAGSAAGYDGAATLLQNFGGLGAGLLLAHYSRDNEREADRLGMEYMTRAGYSPQGMVDLMQVLLRNGRSRPSAIEVMFSTHPMSEERLETARSLARGRYARMESGRIGRERFMDRTARLRSQQGVVAALQNALKSLGEKKYHAVEENLQQALRSGADDYAALVMMARFRLMEKRFREAARYALHAVDVYPGEAQAHLVAAMALVRSNRFQEALEHLDSYDHLLAGNPMVLFYRGLAMEKLQHREEAAHQYILFLRRVRQGKEARYAYGRLLEWGYIRR